MKPFNLHAALAGEPVRLRDGSKAIIYYCVPDEFKIDEDGTLDSFPVKGMIFDEEGYILKSTVSWRKNGKYRSSEASEDIIGMWDESIINIKDLPKAFMPKEGEIYYYIHPHETNFYLDVHETSFDGCRFDEILYSTGNCFRTRKDAQKWINFMKSMKE